MKLREIVERYEAYCPQELSMEGDISGLQLGHLDQEVKTVMVTLDVRETTVAEAIEKKVDLIIVKHAPIFRPLKNLVSTPQNDILLKLVQHGVAVYVSHTNIDVVEDGLNDWFCELLDITHTTYLSETGPERGIGRIGDIAPMTFKDLALKVKETFNLDAIRTVSYGEDDDTVINRVAICGGSGQSFYQDALKQGAQVFITGDIYYHTGQDMITNGLLAIDPGHHIEVLFTERIAARLNTWAKEDNWDLQVVESQARTNPFAHY